MRKRILSILLALALLCTFFPVAAVRASAETTSGSCGDKLTWTFDSATGTLAIKGTGKMFDFNGTANPWEDIKGSIRKITIGKGVTSIGVFAFADCTALTEVSISSTVTSINEAAFLRCTALTGFTIPGTVKSIGTAVFCDCTGLTSVTISSGVTSIGDYAFLRCTGLTGVSIPDTVTGIGDYAFEECSALTDVTIPSSVTSIGNAAFINCTGLKKITVASGNPNYSSDSHGVLFNKDKTKLIQFPGGIKGSYTVPSSVTSIEAWAFEYSTGLTSVIIPGSVTSIGYSAFSACSGLTNVTISNGVASIEDFAFTGCTALTAVTIPASVTSLGQRVFVNCTGLTKVKVASGNPNYSSDSYGVLFNKDKTELIYCPDAFKGSYTIPGTVTSITDWAFNDHTGLTGVTIPDSVTSIGYAAFYGCTGLTSVGIPASVTSIGFDAFIRCGSGSFVIYGVSDSEAQTYANRYNINFIAVVPLKITSQPESATVGIGKSTTFQIKVTGSKLKFQWQYKRAGATSWTDWSGKTEPTLKVTGGSNNNGCKYRCVVSNPLGKKNSNYATLTVISDKPVITTQPKSVSLAVGECMTFTCAATGEGTLRYQWQYKKSGETSWTNWSGATNTYFSVKGSNTNGGCQYRCAVTNDGGTTYSNAATLTITSSHECPGAAFTDMPAYGTIEHTAIDWAIRTGVTNGTSATKFSPNMTVTRSQVVTFLWRACGSPEPKTTKNPFTDVKTTDWFYKAVLWAVEQGITNGTSATKFSPSMVCSRSQILTFLYRQQGSPAVGSVTVPYTDVEAGAFYENAMKWAYANGIDRGTTKTTFSPNVDCIRVSNVVFLYRAITGQGRLS